MPSSSNTLGYDKGCGVSSAASEMTKSLDDPDWLPGFRKTLEILKVESREPILYPPAPDDTASEVLVVGLDSCACERLTKAKIAKQIMVEIMDPIESSYDLSIKLYYCSP
jgi:hypothetical protein